MPKVHPTLGKNKEQSKIKIKGETSETENRPKTAKVKPSIRNQMTRANQKTVKLTK